MDEHREEREELALLDREQRDAIREQAEARAYWNDAGLEHAERVTLETAKPYPKTQQLARGERRYRRKVASPKRWAAIMDAKRGPCRVCKRETTHLQAFRAGSVTFHHVVPRDFGGDDTEHNIVPLCFACHEHVTELKPDACLALCASLTDAEYAYAIGKLGEGAFERVYRVVLA